MIMDPVECIPDTTGYELDAAEHILKRAGVRTISIVTTSKPVYKQESDQISCSSSRVLRQRLLDDNTTVELTICRL